MTAFVRVRDTRTGHEVDVPQRAVRAHHEVLTGWEPASEPRPPVHRQSTTKTAARRPAAQPTTSTETEES